MFKCVQWWKRPPWRQRTQPSAHFELSLDLARKDVTSISSYSSCCQPLSSSWVRSRLRAGLLSQCDPTSLGRVKNWCDIQRVNVRAAQYHSLLPDPFSGRLPSACKTPNCQGKPSIKVVPRIVGLRVWLHGLFLPLVGISCFACLPCTCLWNIIKALGRS